MEEYLCSKTSMIFYSNPFDDRDITVGKAQNDITINLKCEVFEWYDTDVHQTVHSVLHYYLEDTTNIINNVYEEDIKDKFFINGTNLNR
jgi:hypothetical protein